MTTPPRVAAAAAPRPPSHRRMIGLMVALMLGLLLTELDETVFATALPTVVGELDGVDRMLWVAGAYVLAATIVMPVYGTLSDRLGRRPLFVVALTIFVAGSTIGGLSPDMNWLIAARVVQGLGSGGLLILVQAAIADVVPGRERASYLSVVSAVFAVAAVVGPLLGGWLTESVGWRWAFWINVPLGGGAIVAGLALLPRPRPAPASDGSRPDQLRPDLAGIALLAATVSALSLLAAWAGTRYAWSSPVVTVLAFGVVLGALGFVAVERRASDPVIDLHLFAQRNVTLPTVAALLTAVAAFGAIGYLPTYLQMVAGLSPTRSGLVLLALIGGLGLSTVGTAAMVKRTGRYRWLPAIGTALIALALLGLSRLRVDSDLSVVGLWLTLLGLGLGATLQLVVVIVQGAVRPDQLGSATGATSFFREIGVTLGAAIVGTTFTSRLQHRLLSYTARTDDLAPLGVDLTHLTPARLATLPADVRAVVAHSYHDALTPVLSALVPVMVLSAVLLCFVRPTPLAAAGHTVQARQPAAEENHAS